MKLEVGESAVALRTFRQEEFDAFARLSGDDNPIHVDPEYAAHTRFGRTVAHGMFLFGVLHAMLGRALGNPGLLLVEQEMMFRSPTFTDEEVRFELQLSMLHKGGLAHIATRAVRPDGRLGLDGTALVHVPDTSGYPFDGLPVPDAPEEERETLDTAQEHLGLQLGQSEFIRRRFSRDEVQELAALTGETNPLYLDDGYAQKKGLRAALLPGALLGSLFSYLLGVHLPGPGTNWLKQRLVFPAAVSAGEDLLARVEITRLRPEKDLVNLRTKCTNAEGITVCDGRALVRAPNQERKDG